MNTGHILSTSPPIVETILKYLSARDLCNCAQVCSLWKSMAAIEKSRRKDIVWFFKVGLCDDYDQPLHITYLPSSPLSDRMESDLHTELVNNRIEPTFCMTFATSHLFENFEDLFPSFSSQVPDRKKSKPAENFKKRNYLNSVVKTALKPYLPAGCPVTFTVAPGVIGCCKDNLPVEIEDGPAISGFLIPKLSGVEVHHFPVNGRNCNISNLVSEKTSVKCLLIFLTSRGMSFSNRLVQSCLLKEGCRLAIGGAIVERTESLLGSVIAFCGQNVEAASVIICPHDQKAEVKAKLEKFQETGFLKHRCFAYMFACVGRGYHQYQEHNAESSLFHKLYPNVPLIGLFGNGEIGVTYFPHLPVVNKVLKLGKFKRSVKKYLHSYTTVFVLICIKV